MRRKPGSPKTGPLPLAQVREQIRQLPRGPDAPRAPANLYQQHRDGGSRRQINAWVADERHLNQHERRAHLQFVTWHDAHIRQQRIVFPQAGRHQRVFEGRLSFADGAGYGDPR